MIVYGEYLFAENFITEIAIILIVAKICKEKIRKTRLIFTGLLSGIYGFSILLQIPSMILIVSEVLISLLIVVVAFGKKPWLKVVKTAMLFFLITYLWGGIAMALLLLMGDQSMLIGTFTYMDIWIYLRLMGILGVSYGLLRLGVCILKEQRLRQRLFGNASIHIGGNHFVYSAIVDSGNLLIDPVSGAGVSILSRNTMGTLIDYLPEEKMVLIPYKTISEGGGILKGYRVDYIEFMDKKYYKQIIAFSEENFGYKSEYEMLLNTQMLERGLNEPNT